MTPPDGEGTAPELPPRELVECVEKEVPKPFNLETLKATLDACTHDLDQEQDRLRSIDAKLSQLAAFSGVSISISATVGGSVLAAGRLSLGFLIALGASITLAAAFLLFAVITAFRGLAPKLYIGPTEEAITARTTGDALRREPEDVMATFVGSRRDVLVHARAINDGKARATTKTFIFAGTGFALIVLAVVVTAVGSVV